MVMVMMAATMRVTVMPVLVRVVVAFAGMLLRHPAAPLRIGTAT